MSAPREGRRPSGAIRVTLFVVLIGGFAATVFAAGSPWAPAANIALGVIVAVVGITLARMRRSTDKR